jgi:hypothetical protein
MNLGQFAVFVVVAILLWIFGTNLLNKTNSPFFVVLGWLLIIGSVVSAIQAFAALFLPSVNFLPTVVYE